MIQVRMKIAVANVVDPVKDVINSQKIFVKDVTNQRNHSNPTNVKNTKNKNHAKKFVKKQTMSQKMI
jgi:hypothetical protein